MTGRATRAGGQRQKDSERRFMMPMMRKMPRWQRSRSWCEKCARVLRVSRVSARGRRDECVTHERREAAAASTTDATKMSVRCRLCCQPQVWEDGIVERMGDPTPVRAQNSRLFTITRFRMKRGRSSVEACKRASHERDYKWCAFTTTRRASRRASPREMQHVAYRCSPAANEDSFTDYTRERLSKQQMPSSRARGSAQVPLFRKGGACVR